MRSSFVVWIFNLTARLPLGVLHRLGAVLGWATYFVSGTYARRMRENLGFVMGSRPEKDFRDVLNASIAEAGKGVAELPWLWCRPLAEVNASVKERHGWELVEAARARQGDYFFDTASGLF